MNSPKRELRIFTPEEGATEHIGLDHLPHVSTFVADWVADTCAEVAHNSAVAVTCSRAADGYWCGPIWAPSTMLVEDGLRRAGQVKLADEISRRFLRLCEQSGFAENFDALTGEGLRDHAYTWTAATYLILARAFIHGDGTNLAGEDEGNSAVRSRP